MLNFKWVERDHGEALFINHIRVAGYQSNPYRAKGDGAGNTLIGMVSLPSLKTATIYSAEPGDIKKRLVLMVKSWFREINRRRK